MCLPVLRDAFVSLLQARGLWLEQLKYYELHYLPRISRPDDCILFNVTTYVNNYSNSFTWLLLFKLLTVYHRQPHIIGYGVRSFNFVK